LDAGDRRLSRPGATALIVAERKRWPNASVAPGSAAPSRGDLHRSFTNDVAPLDQPTINLI
jgi:hypothetical protein